MARDHKTQQNDAIYHIAGRAFDLVFGKYMMNV
jgi:hypothetical protein